MPREFVILIVDDHPENLKLLANMLVEVGYKLNFAKNGKEARQRISQLKPDLILLDLRMPEENGFQVCHQIKQDLNYQDVPIIFITVSKEPDDLKLAFELGAVDYVNKPFQHQEVLARIKAHLTIKKQREELQESEAKFNTIVTHLYDGILIVDQDGVVKFANPAVARMFGQPLEVVLNHTLGIPILNTDRAELDIVRPDGKLGLAEITVAKTEWQGEVVDIICLRDISDRTKTMQKLEAALTKEKELSQQLETLATIDSLTNIYNRRQIMKLATQEFARSIRYQHPFSILMMDIDKLKIINDTYGHQIGDRVIIEMVKEVLKNIRNVDIFGRLGGDEFMAVLPETNMEQAVEVAERICSNMRNIEITLEADIIKIYISIGVASYTKEIKDLDAIIASADKALYQAKAEGRHQFCISSN